METQEAEEYVFTLKVRVSVINDSQAFVNITSADRIAHDGTLKDIAAHALEESPLTKDSRWSRGNVWRPINPKEDGDDVTIAFLKIKSR